MSKAFLISPAMADTFLAQNWTAAASRMLLPASTLKQNLRIFCFHFCIKANNLQIKELLVCKTFTKRMGWLKAWNSLQYGISPGGLLAK